MRKTVATLAVSLVMVFIFAAGTVPVSATAVPSGTISFFLAASPFCSSTIWSPTHGGGGVNDLPNNVGGPPTTAEVLNGQEICIRVTFTNTPDGLYHITSPALIGAFYVTVVSGSGSNQVLMTVSSDVICNTAPIFMSPAVRGLGPGLSGQISHLFIGNGCTTTGVPEFPVAGSLGLLMVVAIAVPLLVAARKWRSPIQIA